MIIISWCIHLYWLYPSWRCSTSQVRPHTRRDYTCMRLFFFLPLLNLWSWCVSVSHDSGKVDLPATFFGCCCPCEPTSLKILPMALAWCCPCTYVYYHIPTMSHPPRSPGPGVAPVPISCPCCFVLSCAYMWSRSLSFLSALVCDLLPRQLFNGSPKAHCQKSISVTILTSTAWRTLGLFGAFPTLVGRHHGSLGATFLGS